MMPSLYTSIELSKLPFISKCRVHLIVESRCRICKDMNTIQVGYFIQGNQQLFRHQQYNRSEDVWDPGNSFSNTNRSDV